MWLNEEELERLNEYRKKIWVVSGRDPELFSPLHKVHCTPGPEGTRESVFEELLRIEDQLLPATVKVTSALRCRS